MDIKVIQQLPDKTVIDNFTGVIKAVNDRKSDIGPYKNTLQSLMANSDGIPVTVTLWGQPEVTKEKVGQTISAACAHDQKGKPSGLMKETDTYQNRNTLKISVSGKCLVQIGEVLLEEPSDPALLERYKALHDPMKAPPTPAATQAQQGSYQPQTPSDDVNGSARIVVMNAKKAAARSGAVYQVAIDRVKRLVDWAEQRGFKVPPEAACAWVTSIKIDLEKQGFGSSMPCDKPVHDYVPSIGDWGHGADRAQMGKPDGYDPFAATTPPRTSDDDVPY